MTQACYQDLRNEGVARNADIYPVYNHIWEYRKTYCCPKGVIFKDREVIASMQMVLDHQLGRLLGDDWILESRVTELTNEGILVVFTFKYGFDGMGQVQLFTLHSIYTCKVLPTSYLHLKTFQKNHLRLQMVICNLPTKRVCH